MSLPPPDWMGSARRAALRLRATTAGARGAAHRRRACRWGLYVGETSRDPAPRFDQHKTDYRAGRYVNRYGLRLLPDLVAHLTPLRCDGHTNHGAGGDVQ